MQNRELILYHNQIHRILALADHKALLINCIKLTMPKWVNADLLNDCDSCMEEDLLNAANLPVMDSLSPEKKSLVHKRYTMIAPALIVVADEYIPIRQIVVFHYSCLSKKFFLYYTTGADLFQSCIKNTLHRLWCRVSLIYSSISSSRSRSVIGTFNAREKITKSISVTNRSPFSTRRIK